MLRTVRVSLIFLVFFALPLSVATADQNFGVTNTFGNQSTFISVQNISDTTQDVTVTYGKGSGDSDCDFTEQTSIPSQGQFDFAPALKKDTVCSFKVEGKTKGSLFSWVSYFGRNSSDEVIFTSGASTQQAYPAGTTSILNFNTILPNPNVRSGLNGAAQSWISIQNTSSDEANCTVNYFQQGQTGDDPVATKKISIPGDSSNPVETNPDEDWQGFDKADASSTGFVGSAVVSCDKPYVSTVATYGGPHFGSAGNNWASRSNAITPNFNNPNNKIDWHCLIRIPGQGNSSTNRFQVSNLDSGMTSINVTYVNSEGQVTGGGSFTFNKTKNFNVTNSELPEGFAGMAVISSDKPIAVTNQTFFQNSQTKEVQTAFTCRSSQNLRLGNKFYVPRNTFEGQFDYLMVRSYSREPVNFNIMTYGDGGSALGTTDMTVGPFGQKHILFGGSVVDNKFLNSGPNEYGPVVVETAPENKGKISVGMFYGGFNSQNPSAEKGGGSAGDFYDHSYFQFGQGVTTTTTSSGSTTTSTTSTTTTTTSTTTTTTAPGSKVKFSGVSKSTSSGIAFYFNKSTGDFREAGTSSPGADEGVVSFFKAPSPPTGFPVGTTVATGNFLGCVRQPPPASNGSSPTSFYFASGDSNTLTFNCGIFIITVDGKVTITNGGTNIEFEGTISCRLNPRP